MHTRQVGKHTFLVDVQTGGLAGLVSSYVIIGNKAVIVDCGPSTSIENLCLGLKELKVAPEQVAYVALTHVHADHSSGTAALLEKLPTAKVIVHKRGFAHLVDPSRLWVATKETLDYVADIFGEPKPVPEDRIVVASEGITIDVGNGVQLNVIDAPGHSPHNLCFFNQDSGELFVGDSAGAYFEQFDVVIPTTPPPFRPDIALATLDKLIALNPKTLLYPHFGTADDGTRRLCTYAVQIKTWQAIAEDNAKKGGTIDTLRQRLFSEDETVPENLRLPLVAAMEANPVHKKTLLGNSVKGFFDYAQTLFP
jgi:glyoxylase-like metal-dependent hydrolase (beta-lactamase superfamily II)